MMNSLRSKADFQREQMNSLIIQTSDPKSHQAYMLTLLNNAVEYGLISEYRMKDITELIMEEVVTLRNSLVIYIANTVYILNAHLRDMSGYDGYHRLQQIESSEDAKRLIEESNLAWQTKLAKCQERLFHANNQAKELQNENLLIQVKEFSKLISSLKKAVSSQDVNLLEVHEMYAHNIPMTYILLKECNTGGILNNLWNKIFCFAIETSMLCKLKQKGFLTAINQEDEAFISKVEKQKKRLMKKMSAEKKLISRALREKKAEKIALSSDITAERRNINEEIEREEVEAVQRVEKRYELQFNELSSLKEGLVSEFNLSSVASRITLFIMASNGEVQYPKDIAQLIKVRNVLSTKKISEVLLEFSGIELSNIEKEYLLKISMEE